MTDRKLRGTPRHAGRTREVPLFGYHPKHYAAAPPTANPHVVADGSNTYTWPTQTNPARVMRTPTPPHRHVPTSNAALPSPATSGRPSWTKALLWAAVLAVALAVTFALVAAVALVVTS